jgi:hypothetical protein
MKKITNRTLAIVFGSLLLVSVIWIAVIKLAPQDKLIAEISVEGKLLHTIDLNQVKQSYTIKLPHNTVLVEHGQISMQDADCPDQLCVKQGVIKNSAFPIVCLPNKVIIRITGKSEVDAVAGR